MTSAIFHNRNNILLIDPERHGNILHTNSKWSRFVFVGCFKSLIYSINLGTSKEGNGAGSEKLTEELTFLFVT